MRAGDTSRFGHVLLQGGGLFCSRRAYPGHVCFANLGRAFVCFCVLTFYQLPVSTICFPDDYQ